jgi:hypothetical protein
MFDDDLAVVVRQLEDDVLVLLSKLEVVECVYAILRGGGSGNGISYMIVYGYRMGGTRRSCLLAVKR